MPYRKTPLIAGEYYHIFNRGVAHMSIFIDHRSYRRFINSMTYYQMEGPKPRLSHFNPKVHSINLDKHIVKIICYCLMPNHFHLLVKPLNNKALTEFMRKLQDSYSKYFNTRSKRVGPILQGMFKAVLVQSNEQLLHLSRYIHLNPLVSVITKNLKDYRWSSFPEYLNLTNLEICSKEIVLDQFQSTEDYYQFVLDQESYGRELELIKHQLLEE